jgi:sulfotransferase
MDKTIHFISGLPRGGGTLLCNILAQNPKLHMTSPAGALELLFAIRHRWNQVVDFQATPNEAGKLRVLRATLNEFYSGKAISAPVALDKSRGWLSMLEMAELLLEREARVIVPVRDVREVLASFERFWETAPKFQELVKKSVEKEKLPLDTAEQRCACWLRPEQPVGLALNRIRDAMTRGFRDRMLFVEYERLTRQPLRTVAEIYDFLELPHFKHEFARIQHKTFDIDEMIGYQAAQCFPKVRPKLVAHAPEWPQRLGPWAEKYARHNRPWQGSRKPDAQAPSGK